MTDEPPSDCVADIPTGLTEDELDEVIAMRAARRWADEIGRALGLADE